MSVEENLMLMKTLDDAWNSQDWETFNKRHADNVAVFWPGQPEPTRDGHAHNAEAIEFFKTFPDNRVANNPYNRLYQNHFDFYNWVVPHLNISFILRRTN
jgi:hypothetical protein